MRRARAGAPRCAAWFLVIGLGWAQAAGALTDVPTAERRAIDLADLASGAGIALPVRARVRPRPQARPAAAAAARTRTWTGSPDGIRTMRNAAAMYSAWSRLCSSTFAALYFSFARSPTACAVPVLPPLA